MMQDYLSFWNIESNIFSDAEAVTNFHIPASYTEEYERHFYSCQQGKGLLLVEGEPNTGKTTLGRYIYSSIPIDQYEVLHFNVSDTEKKSGWLLKKVAEFFNTRSKKRTLEAYRETILLGLEDLNFERKKLIILIDDAHHLDKPSYFNDIKTILETDHVFKSMVAISLATDKKLSSNLKKCLGGTPINSSLSLRPWSKADCSEFIKKTLENNNLSDKTFHQESIDFIANHSKGNIGFIANLCEKSLLEAYLQKTKEIDISITHLAAKYILDKKSMKATKPETSSPKKQNKESISFEQLIEKDVI